MTRLSRRAALLLPIATGGCSFLDNIFSDAKPPLPGTRESISAVRRGLVVDANNAAVISVPAPTPMPLWTQPGGGAAHVGSNVAIAGLNPAWRADIGDGGGYRDKITAQPIVIPGRVVTMDSNGMVAAFDLSSGSRQWRTDTQGDEDRSTNVGGGVSYADGIVYASTGRAEILALDAGSGAIRWRKPLGAPARSAATVADGKLLVLTLDDRVQAFAASSGDKLWSYQAATANTTLFGQAAPAIADGIAVCAFGSGDLVALRADSGALAWSDSLASARGRSSLVDLSGIRALPVIDNGRVFAIGGGGLLVELDVRSGRRLWEREVGGIQTPWLAGDWLYVQTLDQTLAAINRQDGRVRWLLDLPRYDDPEKRRDPLYWMGPVMAGGKLILGGSNQTAVSVDPVSGKQIGQIDLRDAIAVPPVVASGTMLIVTDDGTLQAFR
jgi:outer membrane protein assembly factor BamB